MTPRLRRKIHVLGSSLVLRCHCLLNLNWRHYILVIALFIKKKESRLGGVPRAAFDRVLNASDLSSQKGDTNMRRAAVFFSAQFCSVPAYPSHSIAIKHNNTMHQPSTANPKVTVFDGPRMSSPLLDLPAGKSRRVSEICQVFEQATRKERDDLERGTLGTVSPMRRRSSWGGGGEKQGGVDEWDRFKQREGHSTDRCRIKVCIDFYGFLVRDLWLINSLIPPRI